MKGEREVNATMNIFGVTRVTCTRGVIESYADDSGRSYAHSEIVVYAADGRRLVLSLFGADRSDARALDPEIVEADQ